MSASPWRRSHRFDPDVPGLGMVTFVDPTKVRHKRDPGRCYRKAGFRHVGYTAGGLLALRMPPGEMPVPEPVSDPQGVLFGTAS